MSENWNVRVVTLDGKENTFQALACHEITPEKKALWKTAMQKTRQITIGRLKVTFEWRGAEVYVRAYNS